MIVICIARVLSIEAKPHQWCNSPRVVENMIVICISRVLSIEAKPLHHWCGLASIDRILEIQIPIMFSTTRGL
jgi:hypothetical protein